MPIHQGRFLEIGILWNCLTIAPYYGYDFDIFTVFGETIFISSTCMLIIWPKIASIVYENMLYASIPSTAANPYHGEG